LSRDLRIQMDANRRPRERHARPEMASRRNMFSRASCRRCGLRAVLISVFFYTTWALRDILRCRTNLVANGAKQT